MKDLDGTILGGYEDYEAHYEGGARVLERFEWNCQFTHIENGSWRCAYLLTEQFDDFAYLSDTQNEGSMFAAFGATPRIAFEALILMFDTLAGSATGHSPQMNEIVQACRVTLDAAGYASEA